MLMGVRVKVVLLSFHPASTITLAMDLQFDHPTHIHALRPCHTDDATDLVAVGGTHTLEVLSVVRAMFISFSERMCSRTPLGRI